MASIVQSNFRHRMNLGRVESVVAIPNLIDIQRSSYEKFLQADIAPRDRQPIGLEGVFRAVFPIQHFDKTSELVYVCYNLETPKYDVEECRQRGMTFAAPIKVTTQLVVYDVREGSERTERGADRGGERIVRDIKEQEVYFGEIPLMTDSGTFIINGAERVVVSQLHRSPGVFFDHDKGKTHSSGKLLYSARVIPYSGSWLDLEFDHKDLLHVRIDRRRKMPATVLLRALGMSTQSILDYYYDKETVFLHEDGTFSKSANFALLAGQRATQDIEVNGKIVVKCNTKFTARSIKELTEAGVDRLPTSITELVGKVAAEDVVDGETGEVLIGCNEELTETVISRVREAGVTSLRTLFIDGLNIGAYLRDTLLADKTTTQDEAIMEIYRRLRPGDPPTLETARSLFHQLFFAPKEGPLEYRAPTRPEDATAPQCQLEKKSDRYDLSTVGRLKLNHKFYGDDPNVPPLTWTVLTPRDIRETIRHLIELKNGRGSVDDIDHLGNRRVRAVGELMENQYRVGLVRMARAIKERMGVSQEIDTLMPHDLINAKPVSAVVKEYFGSSQLSQFMDQTNPLSEVTHKRRLSALGPGGLSRERAGFEVRDVHATHYGRICPIETPEGPNIGLIASLSCFARVNEHGFVETPYRTVREGRVTGDVAWYDAMREEGRRIAQASTPRHANGEFSEALVSARLNGDYRMEPGETISLMDVAPNQMVSVAAALVPFLEHDDANRALMGANMQRQAVPLLRAEAPLVGTGIEGRVAMDSNVCVAARRAGEVVSVDAERIVIRATQGEDEAPDIYQLSKYQRSNQSTCYTQRPIVRAGDKVKAGDVLADGAACHMGELALGQNVVVAFMPWQGYNFEDSILISERVSKEDIYTSVHIEEFECIARDTKLGKEDVTRDIPNVGEEALKELDDCGVVRIGAEVQPGDILVGKVTPKGESQLSPEEKLLRAIFGEKAGDVRDSSLRVPPGVGGIVIDARIFSRKGTEKDQRAKTIEDEQRAKLERVRDEEVKILRDSFFRKIRHVLEDGRTTAKLVNDRGEVLAESGAKLSKSVLDGIPMKYWGELEIEKGADRVQALLHDLEELVRGREEHFKEKIERLSRGDELPPGVIKMVKVYVAIKRKLQVGDKMAGRHGNKGVVSRILPEEDMPYLPDGTPVDMVLNPLGVPSRMNVGQVLEVHLGWGARRLGQQIGEFLEREAPKALRERIAQIYASDTAFVTLLGQMSDADVMALARKLSRGIFTATPVFDGASETQIKKMLGEAGVQTSGQTVLYDGRTGERFDQEVTVGVMYMLKLHHLVDDKIHARSIGPYSLVTQQPLGGKAQFGGQRLGEMEVWAMEAYGAAFALQEFLTVKSDDVQGRTRMYESIVKGDYQLEAGLPESFNVLIKELQALCLNVELVEAGASAAEE